MNFHGIWYKLKKSHNFKHVLKDFKCRECENREFLYDHVHDEIYCTCCGLIFFTENTKSIDVQ